MKNRKSNNNEDFVQDVRYPITNVDLHLLNEAEHIFGAEGPYKRRDLLINKFLKPIMRKPELFAKTFLCLPGLAKEPTLVLVVPDQTKSKRGGRQS